jgi:hypothetical protein
MIMKILSGIRFIVWKWYTALHHASRRYEHLEDKDLFRFSLESASDVSVNG